MALKYYFAYGSNMCGARLRARVPSAEFYSVASLSGHELRFHKAGRDNSAKCDAFETGDTDDVLHGVVFTIDESEQPVLDRAEGLGNGYEIKTIAVQLESGESLENVFTYYATHFDDTLETYDWYRDFVLAGAREHGLPEEYVLKIERHRTVEDPDAARALLNRNILQSGTRP